MTMIWPAFFFFLSDCLYYFFKFLFIIIIIIFITSLLYLFFFTLQYWFCHTSTWIHHGRTHIPHPEHPISPPSPYHPSGSSQCTSPKHPVLNLDWWFVSYMILYMFQCHSPKSSHPLPLPQSPKDCSIHLCLFCCLAYRVVVTILLNSIYMR